MTAVRVLIGTRKGAFVITSDGGRASWKVHGPLFGGWELYHLKGSPADPSRLFASQSTSWFGQLIQRSDDGGKTWTPVGNQFSYEGVPGTHQWYDGTAHPWEFARVWHLEPSLTDPDTVYAGVEDAALFRSVDGGLEWRELAGLRGHGSGPAWQPGAGGMCLHTIVLDPSDPSRMFVAISITPSMLPARRPLPILPLPEPPQLFPALAVAADPPAPIYQEWNTPEPVLAKLEDDKVDLLAPVLFAHNGDVILPQSRAVLDAAIAILKNHTELSRLRIEGHTDDRGKPAYNLDLSKRRAKAVRSYLVKHGIAAARLEAQS